MLTVLLQKKRMPEEFVEKSRRLFKNVSRVSFALKSHKQMSGQYMLQRM